MIIGYEPAEPVWTVYALRLKGDAEVRYVGMTRARPSTRFDRHLWEAKQGYSTHRGLAQALSSGQPEMVVLSTHQSEAGARIAERDAIRLLVVLGHRLSNSHHNRSIKQKRLSYKAPPSEPEAAAATQTKEAA